MDTTTRALAIAISFTAPAAVISCFAWITYHFLYRQLSQQNQQNQLQQQCNNCQIELQHENKGEYIENAEDIETLPILPEKPLKAASEKKRRYSKASSKFMRPISYKRNTAPTILPSWIYGENNKPGNEFADRCPNPHVHDDIRYSTPKTPRYYSTSSESSCLCSDPNSPNIATFYLNTNTNSTPSFRIGRFGFPRPPTSNKLSGDTDDYAETAGIDCPRSVKELPLPPEILRKSLPPVPCIPPVPPIPSAYRN